MFIKFLFFLSGFFIATEDVFIDYVFFPGYRVIVIAALPFITGLIFLSHIICKKPALKINWTGLFFNILILCGLLSNLIFHQHSFDFRYYYYFVLMLVLFFFWDIKSLFPSFITGLILGNSTAILTGIASFYQRISPTTTEYAFGPNGYGFYQAIIISIIMLALMQSKEQKSFLRKAVLYFGVIFSGYGVFVSGSRMAVMGVLTVLIMYILVNKKRLLLSIKVSIAGFCVVAIVLFVFNLNPNNRMLSDLFLQRYTLALAAETGGSGRLAVYDALINNLPEEILFQGFGPEGKAKIAELNPVGAETHNLYLQIILEYGLILFVVFLFYNIFIVVSYYRKGAKEYALLHVPFLVMAIFLHVFTFPSTLLVLAIVSNSYNSSTTEPVLRVSSDDYHRLCLAANYPES